MKVIETEFTVKAGRGAFRKARKKAFALLKTHGIRNYLEVEVHTKRSISNNKDWMTGGVTYCCMVYVEKHTENVWMQETFIHNKMYAESVTQLIPKDHPWLKDFEF